MKRVFIKFSKVPISKIGKSHEHIIQFLNHHIIRLKEKNHHNNYDTTINETEELLNFIKKYPRSKKGINVPRTIFNKLKTHLNKNIISILFYNSGTDIEETEYFDFAIFPKYETKKHKIDIPPFSEISALTFIYEPTKIFKIMNKGEKPIKLKVHKNDNFVGELITINPYKLIEKMLCDIAAEGDEIKLKNNSKNYISCLIEEYIEIKNNT